MNRPSQCAKHISAIQLLALAMLPAARWLTQKKLQAEIRSLQSQADYFGRQQENARAGLADTHKRMAIARSNLMLLSKG
jgi:hypothetical protein